MSGSKYFVYGGRWRELNAQSGAVAGWARRAHFVYVRRGRLRVAPRRRVLAALQALAVHRPSAAALGARLSSYSKDPDKHRSKRKSLPRIETIGCGFGQQHYNTQQYCCALYKGCNTNAVCPAGAHCPGGASHRVTVDAAVQHLPPDNHTLTISLTNHTPPAPALPSPALPPPAAPAAVAAAASDSQENRPPPDPSLANRPASSKRARRSDSDSDDIFRKRSKAAKSQARRAIRNRNKRRRREEKAEEDEDSSGEMCKELTIPEADVRALRSYVARTRRGALARFDADDEYKLALFYAINPLVYVARCPRTERAIRDRLPLALAPFAARLGLTPSPRPRPRPDSEDDAFQDSNRSKRRSLRHMAAQRGPAGTPYALRHKDIDSQRTHSAPRVADTTNSDHSVRIHDKQSNKTNSSSKHTKRAVTTEDSESDYQSKIDKTSLERIRRAAIRSRRKSRSTTSGDMSETDDEAARNRRVSLRTRAAPQKINIHDSDSDSESIKETGDKRIASRRSTAPQADLNAQASPPANAHDRAVKPLIENNRNTMRKTEPQKKIDAQHSDSNSDLTTEHKRSATRKTQARMEQRRPSLSKQTGAKAQDSRHDSTEETGRERNMSHKKTEIQTKPGTRHGDNDSRANIKLRRNSLRNKDGIQMKVDAQDTNSDNDEQAKNKHKRNWLRNKHGIQAKGDAQDTTSDNDIASKIKHRRNSSHKYNRIQAKSDAQDSSSDSDIESKIKHRRNSLRKKNGIQAKVNVEDTTSDSDIESKVKHRRNSLRKNNTMQRKANAQDSSSDSDIESKIKNRRNSLRKNNRPQAKADTQDTSSDSDRESKMKHRRNSLRKNNEIQAKADVQDSSSDSDIESKIKHRRNSLRKNNGPQAKADIQDTSSDSDRESKMKHRRNSLRKNNEIQAKADVQDSSSDSDIESKIKHRRNSLRKNNGPQAKADIQDTSSDSDRESKMKHRRNSLRNKTKTQAKSDTQVSDSDSEVTISNRRDSLRKKTETQKKDTQVSDSDSLRKTEALRKIVTQDSKAESDVKTSHKRNSLRNSTKDDAQDSHSGANTEHRRHSLRKPTTSQAKPNKQDSDAESTSVNNRRISLRRSTLTRSKRDEQDSGSDYETEKYKQINKDKVKSPLKANVTKSLAKSNKEDSDSEPREAVEKLTGNKRDLMRNKAVMENKAAHVSTKSVNSHSSRGPASERTKSGKQKTTKATDSATISGDSEIKSTKAKTVSSAPAPTKGPAADASTQGQPQHVISKRASASGSKEYSNLEDHAIVAWVLTGGRARLVNGNRLWRELGDHYERLTGVCRSWHSLRNRYLRYILPGLGALHLPPADVSRLRAAAATGEMKAKRSGLKAPRRNSIFHHSVVRSASSRRPAPRAAPVPALAGGESSGSGGHEAQREASAAPPATGRAEGGERRTRRSLRADSPAPAPAPASASAPSPAPAPAPSKSPRTRKLFNPKLVL